ncbi:MAG: hypothetical protein P8Z73_16050 [Desulfobacteraceae bacterium]
MPQALFKVAEIAVVESQRRTFTQRQTLDAAGVNVLVEYHPVAGLEEGAQYADIGLVSAGIKQGCLIAEEICECLFGLIEQPKVSGNQT